jgi:hypothetical protein
VATVGQNGGIVYWFRQHGGKLEPVLANQRKYLAAGSVIKSEKNTFNHRFDHF